MNEFMYSEKEKAEILNIQSKYGIDKERFVKGMSFAEMIVDGSKINEAYRISFGVAQEAASRASNNLFRTKWIQELILYLRIDPEVQYHSMKQEVIETNLRMVRNVHEESKDRIGASNALAKYIIPPASKEQVDDKAGTAELVVGKLLDKVAELAAKGQMVTPAGEIIDVKVLA